MTSASPQPVVEPALIELAGRLADAAGEVIRPLFRQPIEVDEKADSSPVTEADRGAERAIRAILAAERPHDGIIGEEFGRERESASHVWVIDPIDGTRAFITGRPLFGTLIALLRDGAPVLGIIDQPVIHDRWIGAVGHPTLFNGRPARTRPCPELGRAIGAATSPDMFTGADRPAFRRAADACSLMTYGGDCYSYGLLAGGFLDVVIEASMKLYDYAALVPVVTGAGGMITDWGGRALADGGDGRVLAAGDRAVHAEAVRVLAGA